MVNIVINGKQYEVHEDITVLQACKENGIDIPTLCYDERLEPDSSCRLCVVEVEGKRNLITSCSLKVEDGMNIETHSKKVIKARKDILDLLFSNHPNDCLTCEKSGNCKLQNYCYDYNVKAGSYKGEKRNLPIDDSNHFYYHDPNKCILCGKCVRVCSDLQGTSAIGLNERGFRTHVGTPSKNGLEDSDCVSCGNCVSACPVGALMPKSRESFREWETKSTLTTCPYCGVGCQLELITKGNQVVDSKPYKGPSNNGLLCVKGKFGYPFINHPDRLKTPLIKKNGKFEEASWEEALNLIVSKIKETKEKYGANALGGFTSARCTNEENYLFQKLFRAAIGTNNIDHCARLCHASTVSGLATTLGSGAMTNSINEVLDSDVIFIIGSNTTENHPVIATKMKQAKKKGAKIIVADPRKIELADKADIFLQIKPGTNIAVLNGMMNYIIENELYDKDYIEERTENFEEVKESLIEYTPEKVAEICGVNKDDIIKAARMYAESDKAGIYYAMGITQHITGTNSVMAISNLALMCGNVGKENAGVNPLRGQNNVQGACDMGGLPSDLPGYQKVFKEEIAEKFEKAWGVSLPREVGMTMSEILDSVKMLYIMGENPMLSDPDINHVKHSLERIDFLVVQDIFLTETAELADVVLPAASFAEKDGTFTNTERRVQRVRKVIESIGDSKADWQILMEIMNKLGYPQKYRHPSEIMEEIASVTPQYGGITYDRIETEGIQWPCLDKDHPGTKYLYKDAIARGKGLFFPVYHTGSAETTDKEYPYILTTGRVLYQYHTRTMTGRVEKLNEKVPESYIEINEVTANKLGVKDSEKVKVTSRRGSIDIKVKVTDIVEDNVMFIPFHFAEGAANYLTNTKADSAAKIPELKVAAVNVEKIQRSC
ncbi:formate dehydrogenase H [Gottschalkia purinilytica]|uniref:Formate dehydrogenase H n=1 Tax=Gottschalkia purinilytica TaxID=1503 RepID=A0A0L0W6U7_GOTPU|nr:formate dehydrogenase subunit alpha [Gottschalkia purinilytica]KNF07278.1 formate dehydrogenase H [Gottschalkia purinilytica]